ncbi:MAG: sugar phosphate isomerase/epimerase [Proteobacteria bacterium]|nr:sugar phosphate isomerase/epimerase [Pseudomonadota bacterium]MBU1711205.1 sugar phosphate isomerase/epimerase [Pseudomonadota bacterium]
MKPAGLKGCYPWKIGAPSYVMPGDIITNVRLLKNHLDDVQILCFESSENVILEHDIPLGRLEEASWKSGLTYTVHLPTDMHLGASDPALREKGIAEICRVMEYFQPLSTRCFDLHLAPEELAAAVWLENLDKSLEALSRKLGPDTEKICIENIDYPVEQILPLIDKHRFSLCLDLGHIRRYGDDWERALERISAARHIHYHGYSKGKDHQALTDDDLERTKDLGRILKETGFAGVVTLEIYDLKMLEASVAHLHKAWGQFLHS